MHKLNRPKAPHCLNNFAHGRDNWRAVTSADKTEIWQSLDVMQQKRCAYCEIDIKTDEGNRNAHIEHFCQRRNYSRGTFDWANLFGSCKREDSCGTHKDRLPEYKPQDLIKMDVEDPEQFLEFLPDGKVVPVKGLTPQDKHRAQETIRIFNLNGALRQIRKTTVMGYLQTAEEFVQYDEEFAREEWQPLLDEELAAIENLPFATAIKHVLLLALRDLDDTEL